MSGGRLPDEMQAQLDEKRRQLLSAVGNRLLTAEQAKREHAEYCKRIFSRFVTDDGRSVFPIKCNGCGKVTVVASDLQRYKCVCSPNVERYTSQSRSLYLEAGKSAVEELLTPGGKRAATRILKG